MKIKVNDTIPEIHLFYISEGGPKKISSKESKIICVFGSLYLCGNVLNKN